MHSTWKVNFEHKKRRTRWDETKIVWKHNEPIKSTGRGRKTLKSSAFNILLSLLYFADFYFETEVFVKAHILTNHDITEQYYYDNAITTAELFTIVITTNRYHCSVLLSSLRRDARSKLVKTSSPTVVARCPVFADFARGRLTSVKSIAKRPVVVGSSASEMRASAADLCVSRTVSNGGDVGVGYAWAGCDFYCRRWVEIRLSGFNRDPGAKSNRSLARAFVLVGRPYCRPRYIIYNNTVYHVVSLINTVSAWCALRRDYIIIIIRYLREWRL